MTFLSDVPLQHKEMKLIPCDSLPFVPFISAITEVCHYRAMLYQASGFYNYTEPKPLRVEHSKLSREFVTVSDGI